MKNFVKLIKEMRDAQKMYFKTRQQSWLEISKALEARCDCMIDEFDTNQILLFGKKKIYVSIPISGLNVEEQKKRANEIRQRLELEGWQVTTPFDICPEIGQTYGYYMGKDIQYIIDECDAVFFCTGWNNSRGCKSEYEIAKVYCKDLIFERHGK